MIEPSACETMAEVRAGVDEVDERIVTLLGIRMRFMDAAARIKPNRDAVRDEARKAAVIAHAREVAAQVGFPPALVAALYETLVEGSIAYEFERFDERQSNSHSRVEVGNISTMQSPGSSDRASGSQKP
jgi:isochorismate pyruvate lyase